MTAVTHGLLLPYKWQRPVPRCLPGEILSGMAPLGQGQGLAAQAPCNGRAGGSSRAVLPRAPGRGRRTDTFKQAPQSCCDRGDPLAQPAATAPPTALHTVPSPLGEPRPEATRTHWVFDVTEHGGGGSVALWVEDLLVLPDRGADAGSLCAAARCTDLCPSRSPIQSVPLWRRE